MGAGVCVATFLAVFVWVSGGHRSHQAPVVREGSAVTSSGDLVWEALREEEGDDEYDQNYVEVLER